MKGMRSVWTVKVLRSTKISNRSKCLSIDVSSSVSSR